MPSEWRWYLGDRDSYLRDRAEELEGQLLASQARERRARAQLQDSFEKRLEELALDLDRLVELTELREELDLHLHHELIRRQVRAQLVALEVVGSAGPSGDPDRLAPPDVADDYWLAPAARALPRLLHRSAPTSLDEVPEVAEARRLDPARADRFLLLVLVLAGRGPAAAPLLATGLGQPTAGPVTAEQRALWQAAAAGALGPGGQQQVIDWLLGRPDDGDAGARVERLDHWQRRLTSRTSGFGDLPEAVRRGYRQQLNPLQDAVAAIWALDGLADRYQQAGARLAAVQRGGVAPTVDRSPVDGAAAAPEPSAHGPGAAPEPSGPVGGAAITADLQWSLIALVDEGTPEEAPLLRRIEQLRRDLHGRPGATGRRPAPEPVDPDKVVGQMEDLLLDDALGRPGATDTTPDGETMEAVAAGLASVAWRADEPVLAELCRQLRRAALDLPDIDPTVHLEISGVSLAVSGAPFRAGEDEEFARAVAEQAYPSPGGMLSRLKDDPSEIRERYRQRCLDQARSTQEALLRVADHLTVARAARARALTELAPLDLGRDPAST